MADDNAGGAVLVLNAGSSSIKFAVFAADLTERLSGAVTEIGGSSELTVAGQAKARPATSHEDALQLIFGALAEHGDGIDAIGAAAHRVVHGGARLTAPAEVNARVRAEIEACSPLAPLHNPHNLAAIDAVAAARPDMRQFVSFDTSFHATNPEVATRYAIPETPETEGIRRYGFHGLSYASLTLNLPRVSGEPLPHRLLAFHLGNGASLCAIRNGKSVATTMGYSPLDGLTMGTRCGGIDANAVLTLVDRHGVDKVKALLNNQSGLLGLSGGKSDMRKLMTDHSASSAFAVEHFCYWTLRHAGSLIASMGGLDAIAFTGGIGEHAMGVRMRILQGLGWAGVVADPDANHRREARLHGQTSKVAVWVVPAEEEKMIARDALALMRTEALA